MHAKLFQTRKRAYSISQFALGYYLFASEGIPRATPGHLTEIFAGGTGI